MQGGVEYGVHSNAWNLSIVLVAEILSIDAHYVKDMVLRAGTR